MKNFGTLYYYELKKLLKRPLSWIMVFVIAWLCVNVGISRGAGFTGIGLPVFDENGNETGELIHISGQEMYDTYARTWESWMDG